MALVREGVPPISARRYVGARGHDGGGRGAVHDFMALGYVTAGRGLFELGDRYAVSAGDVCLVPAGSVHRMLAPLPANSPAVAMSSWGIGFCATCLGPSEFRELLAPFERAALGGSPVVPIPADRQAHLLRLCDALHEETGDGHHPRGAALAQRSLLALILTEVLRATALTAEAAPPTLVGEALRFVERNCLRPLTLADVAAAVHRSPSHVATAVKAATGKTVGGWIVAGRLAEARNRLLHTDGSVEAIATHIGYADTTHFIRMFRKMHTCTPAVWRERATSTSARGEKSR